MSHLRSVTIAAMLATAVPFVVSGCGDSNPSPPEGRPLVAAANPTASPTPTAAEGVTATAANDPAATPPATATSARDATPPPICTPRPDPDCVCFDLWDPLPGPGCVYPNGCAAMCAQRAHTTPTPRPTRSHDFAGCAGVTAESHYCVATAADGIRLLGLDSGTLCRIVATSAPLQGALPPISSIAWADDHIYLCAAAGLVEISLGDGSWRMAATACDAVALYDGGLLVDRGLSKLLLGEFSTPAMSWYPSFADVENAAPQRTFDLGGFSQSMTVREQTLYTAWHAGVGVDVGDLATDRTGGVLTLEDYDGWMLSISATEDGYLAVLGDPWGASVYLFDAYDGRLVRRLDLDEELYGLSCVAGDDAEPRDTPTPTPTATVAGDATATPTPCDDWSCPDPCDFTAQPPPFPLYALPPSIDVASCRGGGSSSNYAVREELLDPDAAEELDVIGIYESGGDPGFRPYAQGVVDVTVHARPLPVALALSSYQAMRWRITLTPGARISRVIVQGYGPQSVDGIPAGVPVIERRAEEACGYAYGWETSDNDGGGGYSSMLASLRRYTGLVETSFQGCYTGGRFDVPYWTGDPPSGEEPLLTGDETIANAEIAFPGCEAIQAEGQYCLTTSAAAITLIGLASGQTCSIGPAPPGHDGFLDASIAWRGEILYTCAYGEGLRRTSLVDGGSQLLQIACNAAATYDHQLLLSPSWSPELLLYPSLNALLANQPTGSFYYPGGASRIATHGDVLYSAWHSTDRIERVDLLTGEPLSPIQLQGFDAWVYGVGVADGGEILLIADSPTPGFARVLHIFAPDSGALLRSFALPAQSSGLACVGAGGES